MTEYLGQRVVVHAALPQARRSARALLEQEMRLKPAEPLIHFNVAINSERPPFQCHRRRGILSAYFWTSPTSQRINLAGVAAISKSGCFLIVHELPPQPDALPSRKP